MMNRITAVEDKHFFSNVPHQMLSHAKSTTKSPPRCPKGLRRTPPKTGTCQVPKTTKSPKPSGVPTKKLKKGQLIWQGFGPFALPAMNPQSFDPSQNTFQRQFTRFFSLCEFVALGYARNGSYACFKVNRQLTLLDANAIDPLAGDDTYEDQLDSYERHLINLVNKYSLDGYIRTNLLDDDRGIKYHISQNSETPYVGGIEHSMVNNRYSITCPEVYIKYPRDVLDMGPYGARVKELFRSNVTDWDVFRSELTKRASNQYDYNLLTFMTKR